MAAIMTAVRIPHDQLSKEALQGVIEEFITRESTDYGAVEVSLETKVRQVHQNLISGNAILVFDGKTETCNIFHRDDPLLKELAP
jgi:uncharacterized protein YheU (UPF0270 family)